MKASYVFNFEDVMTDITSHFKKIDTNQYRTFGATPIIDQSAKDFCGYTDIESEVDSVTPPYIVFGDHTRRFKFVDVDFVLGADGTKVLKAKVDADHKYLFHFLSSIKLEEAGYSRHYKYLKRTKLFVPPLAEQQRIAALLDTADRILKLRELAIAKLDQLAQSVFVEMFGDPLANLKNFETVKVSGICKLVNGRAFKPTEWKESGKPIIRIQNLNDETKPFNYTQENFDEKYLIKNGDVLFSWSGTPGTSFGCFKWLRKDGWLNQHIFKVILNEKLITADFFIMQMNLKIGELISQAHGGVGLQHVTKKMVDELPLLLPSMKLQLDFCKRVTEFEKIKRITSVRLKIE